MTRLLPLFALLAVAFAAPAHAEDAPPQDKGAHGKERGKRGPGEEGMAWREQDPKEMAARHVEHMKQMLKLTDDQAKKVADILAKSQPEREELMKKLQASERKTHEQIRALLDDEQKEKFDMMRAHMMMRHGGMGMGSGPGGMQGGPGGMHGGPRGMRGGPGMGHHGPNAGGPDMGGPGPDDHGPDDSGPRGPDDSDGD
jgi:hypothetical protein